MIKYRFAYATIRTWDPDALFNMVQLDGDGTTLAARLLGDLRPDMYEVGAPIVLAIKNGNAFILGRHCG